MGSKNLAVMMSAMMLVRTLDQEDPAVLMRTRLAFGAYVALTSVVYYLVHLKIVKRNDRKRLEVPVARPPFGPGSDEPPTTRVTTVVEYDLELLKKARQGWLFNTLLLTAIHYKMQTVSPLIMSGLMTAMRLLSDDPLVQLHLFGAAAQGKLVRPFKPEENPLQGLLKGMLPKADEPAAPEVKDDGNDTESEDESEPKSLRDRERELDEDDEDDELDADEKKKDK